PHHILGLQGMPRRIYRYPAGFGWEFWNLISTIGAFTIGLSVLIFLVNVIQTTRKGRRARSDPWDGRTLEWTIPSPPPHYNFREIPTVHSRDDFWHRKYSEDEAGRPVRIPVGASQEHAETASNGHEGHGDGHGIHMPSPSYWPAVAALGLPFIGYGLIFNWIAVGVGAVITLVGLYGWALEPVAEE
ncbi:MAG: cytochrome ubiquinol oxidase subunit I, partial [Acidimicrobiia bacterium]